jgi:hypothetical protein
VNPTSFHEAAHAVTAVILGMSEVQAVVEQRKSETGIPINGETVCSFFLLPGETPQSMFRRRVAVTFAGPTWETHSDPKFRPRSFHLRAQKADCIKAKQVIRCARVKCGLKGAALVTWLEEAWQDAEKIVETEFDAILAVAEGLDEHKTLDDATIRRLMRDVGRDFPSPKAVAPPELNNPCSAPQKSITAGG